MIFKMLFHKQALLLCLLMALCPIMEAKKVIKVLAIGNSFSEDAVEQHLYGLAEAQGQELIIGNAVIGGCSIDRHWNNALTGEPAYRYSKITKGHTATKKSTSLQDIIKDENWDIITLQQASPTSGILESYQNLQNLKDYVLQTATNPKVRITFHMTWAYAKDSNHNAFPKYDKDQMKMYRAICHAVDKATLAVGIKDIIPCGITIQNARAELGDVLCRDGHHLSNVGRYAAACTWCAYLTGKKVSGNTYRPTTISDKEATIAQHAADAALKKTRKQLRRKS